LTCVARLVDPGLRRASDRRGPAFDTTCFPAFRSIAMLYWAAVFFVIALVAAIFGFGGIAAGAASIAKILFFVFLILFLVSLIAGLFTGRSPRV
jgi:uncharacterized membrane protein YtjA (UPF0391 family)